MVRLTWNAREALLRLNEGFQMSTDYDGKNLTESRTYKIVDGALQIRARGKTSWADSRYDTTWIADKNATHQFLYKYQHRLKDEGVIDLAKSIAADRAREKAAAALASVPLPAPTARSVSAPTKLPAPVTLPGRPLNVDQAIVWMGVAAVVVNVGVAAAPRVKQLWREQVDPRAKRLRGKPTTTPPAAIADTVENPDDGPDPTPDTTE